jgi:hypothetical protein
MRHLALSILVVTLTVVGCKNETASDYEDLSLLQYGVPFSIKAPADAKVKKASLGIYEDITIKAGDKYQVQLLVSDATTLDATVIKADLLEDIKRNPFFAELIEETDNGFVYRKEIDSTSINYSFRHVRIQGDKEYIFQPTLVGQFTLDDVKAMHTAVQ